MNNVFINNNNVKLTITGIDTKLHLIDLEFNDLNIDDYDDDYKISTVGESYCIYDHKDEIAFNNFYGEETYIFLCNFIKECIKNNIINKQF